MEYIVPTKTGEVLRAIYRALVLHGDPEATFVDAEPDPEPETVSDGLYGR